MNVVYADEIICRLNEKLIINDRKKWLKDLNRSVLLLKKYCCNELFCILENHNLVGEVSKTRQNTLRKLGIFGILIRYLEEISEKIHERNLFKIAISIFDLFSYLCKDNIENKLNLLEYANVLKLFLRHDNSFSAYLTTIIKDCKECHSSRLDSIHELISEHAQIFVDTKKSELIPFLDTCCVCQRSAVPQNQELIRQLLIIQNPSVLKIPQIKNGSLLFEFAEKVTLESCFENGFGIAYQEEIIFFSGVLKLIGSLCDGRNYLCIDWAKQWFYPDILLNYAYSADISDELRGHFLKVFEKTVIDIHPRHIFKYPSLAYKTDTRCVQTTTFSRVNADPHSSLGSDTEGPLKYDYSDFVNVEIAELDGHIINLKQYILRYIAQCTSLSSFTLKLLGLMRLMIKMNLFQGFKSEELKNQSERALLMKHLGKMINSMIFDLASADMTLKSGFSTTSKDKNKISFEFLVRDKQSKNPIKKYSNKIIKYLNSLSAISKYEDSSEDKCLLEILDSYLYFLDWRQDKILAKILTLKVNSANAKEVLRYIPNIIKSKSHNSLLSLFSKKILATICKLLVKSKDFKVKDLCLTVIYRACLPVTETIGNAEKILSLSGDIEYNAYEWSKENQLILLNLTEKSELWIRLENKEFQENHLTFLSILEKFSCLLFANSSISNHDVFVSSEKVSPLRQKMFFNLKIHRTLMNFISEDIDLGKINTHLDLLFAKCFEIIRKMIQGNSTNQLHFFKYIKFFCLNLERDLGQIDLLIEIFKDNNENCISIDTDFIDIFKDCILKYGRQSRFLKIFEHIQLVNGLPYVDNQLKVMNFILDRAYYQFFCYSKGKINIEFTYEVEMPGDEPILYHAVLISLLALCSAGISDIELNESKCMRIIPLDTVFSLLEQADAIMQFRPMAIPLLNFFLEVYLDSKHRFPNLAASNEFIKLIKRSYQDIALMEMPRLEVTLKILRTFSESYMIAKDLMVIDPLYQEIIAFLDRLHQDFENIKLEENRQEISENIDKLLRIYDKDYYFAYQNPVNFEQSVDEWESRKVSILNDQIILNCIKKEKTMLSNLINDEHQHACTSRDLIDHLLSLINFYKIKKLSKKTVCRAIFVLTAMITDEKTKIRARKEIVNLSGIHIILQVLSEKDTSGIISDKLLHLCVKLLKNCEPEVQEAYYSFFTTVPESENIFLALSSTLSNSKSSLVSIDLRKFKEYSVIFKFLKLLCENHFVLLQHYLRHQEKSLTSYNFIHKSLKLLEDLIKSRCIHTFKPISLCFDFLAEMCQGPCQENQKSLIDTKIIQIVSDLLSIDESSSDLQFYPTLFEKAKKYQEYQSNEDLLTGWMVAKLKLKALVTLHSLIEGNRDKYIISQIIRTMNMNILKDNLLNIYINYKKEFKDKYSSESFKTKESKADNIFIIELGFLIYHLMRIFQESSTEENKEIVSNILPELEIDKSLFNYLDIDIFNVNNIIRNICPGKSKIVDKPPFEESARFFEKNTGNIDVDFNGKMICKAYFWLNPECQYLTNESKADFHDKADRTSDKAKLVYLLSRADDIIERIQHEMYVQGLISRYKIISFISNDRIWKLIAFILAIVLNCYILGFYSEYTQQQGLSQDLTLSTFPNTSNTVISLFHSAEIVHIACSIMMFLFYYLQDVPVLYKRIYREKINLKYTRMIWSVILIHANINTIYVSVYLIFSFLGAFYHVFYFAFHLLDFLYRFPSLQSVIYSVVLPYKILLMLYFLILIAIYIFSIIAYIFYAEYFNGNCDGLLLCAVSNYVQGMKNSGGVGYYMYWNDPYVGYLHIGQFFFENLFNIIIMIIMFNILTGIIVSTFTVLREMSQDSMMDQNSKCFICGLAKNTIEELTKAPFKFHRKYDHNEWNYIFFILYLRSKPSSKYSGIETYVADELKKDGIDWIPQGKGYSIPIS